MMILTYNGFIKLRSELDTIVYDLYMGDIISEHRYDLLTNPLFEPKSEEEFFKSTDESYTEEDIYISTI